jgi:hypothetical protein
MLNSNTNAGADPAAHRETTCPCPQVSLAPVAQEEVTLSVDSFWAGCSTLAHGLVDEPSAVRLLNLVPDTHTYVYMHHSAGASSSVAVPGRQYDADQTASP